MENPLCLRGRGYLSGHEATQCFPICFHHILIWSEYDIFEIYVTEIQHYPYILIIKLILFHNNKDRPQIWNLTHGKLLVQ